MLLVWLTGASLLLGLWGHSLLMKSCFVYRSPGLERHFQLGLAAGSLTFNIHAHSAPLPPLHRRSPPLKPRDPDCRRRTVAVETLNFKLS
jgi:hypothetical protein